MHSAEEIHSSVLDYLNENLPYFASHFLAMGRPWAVNDTEWAYVVWSEEDGEALFCLNEENVSPLDLSDQVFLCMHETLHVFLKHNLLAVPNDDLRNIAADIVINDYLVDNGMTTSLPLYFGPNILGFSCSELPVVVVYKMLKDQGFEAPQQHAMCGFAEHGDKIIDIPSDQLPDAPPDLAGMDVGGDGYSLSGEGMDRWAQRTGTSLKWAEVLRDVNPRMFATADNSKRVASFSRLHRKVAWDAPRTLLPVARKSRLEGDEEEGKIPGVVIAVDVSSSISSETRDDFITLVNSMPDGMIKGYYCTFNTSARQFLKGDYRLPSGGGTNFAAIEGFIQKAVIPDLGGYPDAVVVLTDGESSFQGRAPTSEDYGKWIWLLRGGRLLCNKGNSKVHSLNSFMQD